jgi:hypothetical protein
MALESLRNEAIGIKLIFLCSFLLNSHWRFFMYAIVQTGGKQIKVAPGDIVEVEKLAA